MRDQRARGERVFVYVLVVEWWGNDSTTPIVLFVYSFHLFAYLCIVVHLQLTVFNMENEEDVELVRL